ncbi:MAG: hypothetical protein IT210_22710 [Armatimonadetes bacterium]|nr:hypothetical protein [Armatimonadota bacterium]
MAALLAGSLAAASEEMSHALSRIETCASFLPHAAHPLRDWWESLRGER